MYRVGETDLLLINPPFHTRSGSGSFFPLGLGYVISSVVARGFTWSTIDCTKMVNSFYYADLIKFEENLLKELKRFSPVLIGIGPCITSHLRALKIIAKCCQNIFPSTPVVAGGPLASIEEQEWVFFEDLNINYIIKGDGEQAIPDAISKVKQTGDIANSNMISRPGYSYINEIDDIDSILFPYRIFSSETFFSTRRLNSIESTKQAAMISSRGCPYACHYCVSGNLTQRFRKRSLDNIIQEMYGLRKYHGVNDVVFYDDCFFYDIDHSGSEIRNFCDALLIENLDITWQIEMRPDLFLSISDASIICLDKSGCRQINLGIEKTSKKGLEFLGKTGSLNGLREKVFRVKKISKIKISATFILGGIESYDETVEIIKESLNMGLNFAHYNPLFVYPGTPLYNHVFNHKKSWTNKIYNDRLPWGEIVFESDKLKCAELLELIDYAYAEFYKDTEHSKDQMIIDRFNIKQER